LDELDPAASEPRAAVRPEPVLRPVLERLDPESLLLPTVRPLLPRVLGGELLELPRSCFNSLFEPERAPELRELPPPDWLERGAVARSRDVVGLRPMLPREDVARRDPSSR
jgi:hypothetical protein